MTLVTDQRITRDLVRLGVKEGEIVLVHSSLSSIGSVPGGEQAVAAAIRRVVGPHGTIVVPSQSWQLCDPTYLKMAPAETWDQTRDSLPPYDKRWTPTRTMGRLAEAIRTHPEALRSDHPHRSFAAWGPAAADIVAEHALEDPVGEGSPLAVLDARGARILLLGVCYDKCTALHLGESRSGLQLRRVANGAPILVDGERSWIEFTEPAVDDSDFFAVGAAFEADQPDSVKHGRVGHAEARLIDMPALVAFAAKWMAEHRDGRQATAVPFR